MEQMAKQIKAPVITPYGVRHSYGTLLRARGVDIYTIHKVLGHAKISVNADIYVHNDINVLHRQVKLDKKIKNNRQL